VREDAAFRDNLRISLSVPERESSPTHVCVCVQSKVRPSPV